MDKLRLVLVSLTAGRFVALEDSEEVDSGMYPAVNVNPHTVIEDTYNVDIEDGILVYRKDSVNKK